MKLGKPQPACNLLSVTKGQKTIQDLAKAMVDHAGKAAPHIPSGHGLMATIQPRQGKYMKRRCPFAS